MRHKREDRENPIAQGKKLNEFINKNFPEATAERRAKPVRLLRGKRNCDFST
jgi:hypothetical protein